MKEQGFWEVHIYDNEYELVVEYDETNDNHIKVINELYKRMNNMNNLNTLMEDMNKFIDFVKANKLRWYFKRVDD